MNYLTLMIIPSCPTVAEKAKVVNDGGMANLVENLKKVIYWATEWDMSLNERSRLVTYSSNGLRGLGNIVQFPAARSLTPTTLKWRSLRALIGQYSKRRLETRPWRIYGLHLAISYWKPKDFSHLLETVIRPHRDGWVRDLPPFPNNGVTWLRPVQLLGTRRFQGKLRTAARWDQKMSLSC